MTGARAHAAAAAAVLLLGACGSGGSDAETPAAGAGGNGEVLEVTADDMAFHPDELRAEPGAEITLRFVNDDDTKHTFTSAGGDVDLEAEPGATEEEVFTAPDSDAVTFKCSIHPSMEAVVSVGGDGAGGGSESDSDSGRGGYDY